MIDNTIPLVECNMYEQFVRAWTQTRFNFIQHQSSLDILFSLIAKNNLHIGSYIIVERDTFEADVVSSVSDVYAYVSQFGWDMLWWGKVTQELKDFCVEKTDGL